MNCINDENLKISQKNETSVETVNSDKASKTILCTNLVKTELKFTENNAITQTNNNNKSNSGIIRLKSEKTIIIEKPCSTSKQEERPDYVNDDESTSVIKDCDNSLNTQKEDEFSMSESNYEETLGDSDDENDEKPVQVNIFS